MSTVSKSLPHVLFNLLNQESLKPRYAYPEHTPNGIIWHYRSRQQVRDRISSIIQFLRENGVRLGTRVAIISGTRPEWLELDLAILACGGISVSVYPSLPSIDIGFILADSECEIVIAENEEQIKKLIYLESTPIVLPKRDNIESETITINIKKILCIEESSITHDKMHFLSEVFKNKADIYINQMITQDTVSSLVYTSGTTGPSKGVIQTHGNHLANIEQAIKTKMFAMDGDLFLFLPLAHSFARLIGYLGMLTPSVIKFCGVASKTSSKVDLVLVAKEMSSAGSCVVPAVPRLFEKIKDSIIQQSKGQSLSSKILKLTILFSYKPNSIGWLLTSYIRKKLKRKIFGSNFSHAISGGAKLPVEVNKFFWRLGIEIYEGYGLTETCVATHVNLRNKNKIGSVGPAFDNLEVKIAEDGEILFKGPNVSKGYWNRPIATADSFDSQGWFHSGDIGHIDEDGYLFITDRKKDLVITAGGKKVPPLKIENIITSLPEFSQAIYYGDGKPYCIALVNLNPNLYPNIPEPDKLNEIFYNALKKINESLSSFESVKKLGLMNEEPTIENGLLTPTLKLKRKLAIDRFKDLIEKLYQEKE